MPPHQRAGAFRCSAPPVSGSGPPIRRLGESLARESRPKRETGDRGFVLLPQWLNFKFFLGCFLLKMTKTRKFFLN